MNSGMQEGTFNIKWVAVQRNEITELHKNL